MSKKKKKFKKFFKAQLMEKIEKVEQEEEKPYFAEASQDKPEIVAQSEVESPIIRKEKKIPQTAKSIGAEINYVRSDLKRVAWVSGITFFFLIALTIINNQTNWLSGLADDLIKILHIN